MNSTWAHSQSASDLAERREVGHSLQARWPSMLGLGAALVITGGDVSASTTASVVAVIALIYVVAAVTGRQGSAWWALLGSIPVVLSGPLTGGNAESCAVVDGGLALVILWGLL